MTDMQFTDAATISGTRITADGYLVADAYAVRTGIQLYAGPEVGMADKAVVRVYRPESEVRDPKSLASFSHAPVTLNHPTVSVTKDNWADLAKGEVSTEATWDGNRIKLPLIVKDAATIAKVESGEMRDLSAGYNCTLEIVDGVTPDGQPYDAIQRNIRINHLAIVKNGRAGNTRIGDGTDIAAATWGLSPLTDGKEIGMADTPMKSVVLGDQAVQVAVSDAPAIEAFKTATAKTMADAQATHDKAMAAKDGELATRDAEIAKLKAAAMTDAALDKLVADRAALITVAKTVHAAVVTDGKSAAEIKKAVVIAKAGASMSDKSDAYIDARFDVLADEARVDPVRAALMDGAGKHNSTSQEIYAQRDKALSDAWKPQTKKEAV